MRKVQFNSVKYDLATPENRSSSDFQSTIIKGDNDFDAIVADAKSSAEINIYEDDTIVGTYTGYTIFKAATLYFYESKDVVSIELMNADFQSQLNSINSDLADMHSTQNTHDIAIADLGDEIGNLAESQGTQDLAIEDLAEAISELEG